MRVKDVLFRWLLQRPIAIDLRNNAVLYAKYHTDALVVCMWIDAAGFFQGAVVAGMSLQDEPKVIRWIHERVTYNEIADCVVLPGARPDKTEQLRIWNERKQISAEHPTPRQLITVRKTLYLDAYRLKERPDTVICHSESAKGCLVPVHTDGFNGTQLLGTVIEDDACGILHADDQVMIYTLNSILFLDPVLIATKFRYE